MLISVVLLDEAIYTSQLLVRLVYSLTKRLLSHLHFLSIWFTGRGCAVSEVTNSVIALPSPLGLTEEKPQTAAYATPGHTAYW